VAVNARRRPLVMDGAAKVDQLGGKINLLNNQNSGGLQVAGPIRIDVAPTAHGKWRAAFNGETLCTTAAPMVKAARILIAKSYDPSCIIEMWHQNAEAWVLRGQLGAVATTLLDGETAARPAKNGPPARFPRAAAFSSAEAAS
jgi:hypothetical protein